MAISRSPHKTFDKKREAMAAKAAEIRAGEQAAKARSALGPGEGGSLIYSLNANGDRAAFLLPDETAIADFAPDPEGVNIDGSNVARLIYQVSLDSDPTLTNNSRVGAWLSSNWRPRLTTPTKKASHYSFYYTASGDVGDATYPQEVGVIVAKGVTPAAQQNGKIETMIVVAEQEDGSNGKGVIFQGVGRFAGTDSGWNFDEDGESDDSDAGDLSDPPTSDPPTVYPRWGAKMNASGPTPGSAAFAVSARVGSIWWHGLYAKKNSLGAFLWRHKGRAGLMVQGFDPGDGFGARAMDYIGIGTDVPQAPVHVQGAMSLESKYESTQAVTALTPYVLHTGSFWGRNDLGTTTYEMAQIGVEVTDPTHGAEAAELWLKGRWAGALNDGFRIGRGLYSPLAAGGDPGDGGANFKSLYIDGVLALGVDTMAPATPTGVSDPPTQTFRTSPGGTQEAVVTWTWTANTEADLAGYVVAYRRGTSGSFVTAKVEEASFSLQANAGETLQLKVLAHDVQHNKSAYCAVSPTAGYVVTGDSTAPSAVTATTAPALRTKGVVMKFTAPADTNFGGVVIYSNTVNNSSTATALDYVPGKAGKKVKYRDDDAHTAGDTLYYWAASVNRDGVESATRTSLGAAVTYALLADADLDQSVPATPGSGPTLTESATLGSDGVLQGRLQASVATPSDATRILFALQRAGGSFDTQIVDATTTTTTASWVVGPGEACVVKFKSINALGRRSAAYSPTSSKTISGDSTAPAVMTAISVTATLKGMVVKATAPSDKDFVGAQVYRHTSNVPASATALEIAPGRPSRKVKYLDNDALVSGTTYYYFMASVDASDNENATRTLIGSAAYVGVQGADLEVGAVDMSTNKVTGKTGANITYTSGGGTLDSLKPGEAGATKNITYRATTAPTGGAYATGDHWIDTSASPRVHYVWTGSAWEAVGRNTTNTTQVTDGAGLGNTALWTGVTGTGKPDDYATKNTVTKSASAPSSPTDGDIWIDTSSSPRVIRTRIAGAWEESAQNTKSARSGTAPSSPSTGDVWIDTSVSPRVTKVWTGSAWEIVGRNTTLASEVAYTGGSTVDSLKPGEAGANVTETRFAKGAAVDTSASATDQPPSYYTGLGTNTLHELKSTGTLGLTSADTYCTISVKYPGSGAKVIQTADLSDGRWRRSSNGAVAWNAWKKVFDPDNPPSTTDLPDAGGLSRLDPSDLVDYPGRNISGSAGQSITLTYGTDKPNLSVKNTSAGAYTVTLAGGAAGDAFTIGNSTASTQNVSVVGDATYTLPPGTEGVFLYQTSPGGFNLRLQRVLSDLTTNLIPPSLIPVGTSAGTVAAGNDTRIANALQTSVVGVTVQGYSANLAAVSGLTFAADKFMYSTGAGALSLANVTSQGRSILAQSGAIGVQTVLGLVPGTDVQPYDADLAAVAALTSPATTITGAMQKSSNGGDIANTTTFKANLGLATVASSGSASDLSTGVLGSSRGGAGAISGLLKANGAGVVSAASFASDYAASNSTMSWTATHTFTNAPRGATDNAVQLGTAALRWSQLYAGTTTINTSDAREKCEVGDIPQAVIDVICALPIQAFKWIDAVAEKGDAARWHYGWIAQSVAAAVTAAGYDPHAYGFYCVDGLTDLVEDIDVPRIDPETGEQAVRYGLRLDYLFAIRLEGDARRLAALEARVSALEAA